MPSFLTCSTISGAGFFIQPGADQGFLEERAGVGELQVLAVVVHVPDVGQGEDRLAAVALAAGHGGDGAGGGDGGLRGVADAVQADIGGHPVPVHLGARPVVLIGHDAEGRFPGEVLGVVDASR